VLGLGEFFRSRLIRSLDRATAGEYRMQRRIGWTQSGLTLLGSLVTGAGAAVVGVEAAHGHLAIGNLVMFLAAVNGTQSVLVGTMNQMTMVGASVRLLHHYRLVLDARDDLPVPPHRIRRPVPALRYGIELRDVWFRYGDAERWALRGLTAQIPHGQSTALVGVNGAGKSTLIKLLCRLYDPQRGAITWDGEDLRELDPAELRRRLAVTFQDFLTYDLTAGENIGIGDLVASDDARRIAGAAKAVGLDEAIRRLPNGYRTLLSRTLPGEDGGEGALLSGGQNQRLVLARTLMRADADLMVLDEPSSGLDAEAEQRIHENLRRLRLGRTSLLVSHRLSAVRHADRILVLDTGQVTEQGTHDELMAAAGNYARLFTRQAADYQLAGTGQPSGSPRITVRA
jgi:ATP-binding cassette subfamily B protein